VSAGGEFGARACACAGDAEAVSGAVAGDRAGGARVGTRPIPPAVRLGLRADLLVEPHVVDLFDGTLREQLATRAPAGTPLDGSDDDWAQRALRAAGAEDLLEILPEGYDTHI